MMNLEGMRVESAAGREGNAHTLKSRGGVTMNKANNDKQSQRIIIPVSLFHFISVMIKEIRRFVVVV